MGSGMLERRRVGRLLGGLFAAVLSWSSTTATQAEWQAGAAKRMITPTGSMWMAGYASRNHPAEGKLTELWAKALCLQDAQGRRSVLVTLDLIGIDREISQRVCAEIARAHQLSRAQVALCTSHTHTGPVVAGNLRSMHYALLNDEERQRVESYATQLEQNILGVVDEAIQAIRPCTLAVGSGTAAFAVNRRNNPEPQVPELRVAGQLRGPVDHDVPVLAVRDAAGKLTTVVFGYACHSTVLSSYEWSGDYGGFAQLTLEQDLPGCIAMFWAGCGGDQNPLPRRQVELARQYGHELSGAVKQVLDRPLAPVAAALRTSYAEIDLPLAALPDETQLRADAASQDLYVAARAKLLLQQLAEGRPLSPTYPYPIAVWKLGDQVEWIFLGGEVVVDYAVRLKTVRRGTQTWVAAYANDVMAYIPSRRVLLEGGYEGGGAMVYYGLPAHWAPEVEERIVAEAQRQLE